MSSRINFELNKLRLVKSLFTTNPGYNPPAPGELIAMGVMLRNKGEFSIDGGQAQFIQNFKTQAAYELPFSLEVEFEALFALSAPITETEREPFLVQVFPQVIFPFMREYVAETTRRAGFPPLLINQSFYPTSPGEESGAGAGERVVTSKWFH
ncbi:MAG: protein-export chaperone SecB [Deltaproteobacteria bacterium]|jgi:preprotein translocase subunit SecB|nr:protein-export chaperone SecB [Deltaproteobacteria bacterium]